MTSSVSLCARCGPRLVGTEPVEARALEGRLRLVERGAREAEGAAWSHGLAVERHAAEHLVLDLHEIARVEEVVAREGGVSDALGTPVEAAGGAQRFELRIRG